ncbi:MULTISPECIES: hypothetical protein [Brevibacterium]|uniref:Uncharacterized protein n=1 Tax=Brevibacterium casei TaxID=33889 RepID=A0A7T4DJH4_9MICO|nr:MULTISPECIES: hypothetical protein [Brevibacterium]QQB14391.1 hypothetical protein I6H47_16930 [Brevibacterium casei]
MVKRTGAGGGQPSSAVPDDDVALTRSVLHGEQVKCRGSICEVVRIPALRAVGAVTVVA